MPIKVITLFFFIVIISSCKKYDKVNCGGDDCLGKQTLYLNNNDKSYLVTKDTIYKFINANNDTLKLKFRKQYNEAYHYNYACNCEEKSTNITGDCTYSIYTFLNRNIAIQYAVCATLNETTAFDIDFGDTNKIVNKISTSNDTTSQFWNKDILTKKNDIDSLYINGSYYYNIINTYDHVNGSTHPSITNCMYSKKFGIVSFKYNNIQYSIIH